jgi:hypothetical protein
MLLGRISQKFLDMSGTDRNKYGLTKKKELNANRPLEPASFMPVIIFIMPETILQSRECTCSTLHISYTIFTNFVK